MRARVTVETLSAIGAVSSNKGSSETPLVAQAEQNAQSRAFVLLALNLHTLDTALAQVFCVSEPASV